MINVKVCGVLIEPRPLENIYKLIDNFHNVLNNTLLYFFCGKTYYNHYINYYINNPLVKVISLDVDNFTSSEHNDFCKKIEFWNTFSNEYTHVLTIQTDGCLCKNSTYKIQDFYEYDYIGGYTPNKWWWKETKGLHDYDDHQCFNGGFSFRNINAARDVINTYPPLPSREFSIFLKSFRSYGEDLYFVVGLFMLNKTHNKKYKIGLDEKATKFCTHTHYLYNTFCIHKYDNYTDNNNDLNNILKYCPEFIHFTKNNTQLITQNNNFQ
jgi:hypothetical protein